MSEKSTYFDAVVIGMGKTGLSCARHLAARGISFAVADSRQQPPEMDNLRRLFPEVPVFLGRFDPSLFCNAGRLILSPGVPKEEPAIQAAVDRGVEIAGDIELFARQVAAPVIAVTGSNGKSTVASMTAAMIRQSGMQVLLGGNIGTPALDLLTEELPHFYVLELSSFQLETVYSLRPSASVVLNVTADHMDRYPDMASYAAAKQKIYQGAEVMVINKDDPASLGMKLKGRIRIEYSASEPETGEYGVISREDGDWLARGREGLMPVSELKLPGRHNVSNALAALALGSAVGLPESAMLEVLRTFSGLPHRCKRVGNIRGIEWINDSKATNVGAACAAITGLGGQANLVLIAGGDGKAADFTSLAAAVRGRVHTAILIGRDAGRLAESIKYDTAIVFATTMESAVSTAAKTARRGDTVLLSPACASLDMFRDYQERGEAFMAAVRSLEQEGTES